MTDLAAKQVISPSVMLKWREDMEFSQRDAADALGCSRNSIGNWENGISDCPYYIGLAMTAVAKALPPYGSNKKRSNHA